MRSNIVDSSSSLVLDTVSTASREPDPRRRFHGWRRTVSLGAGFTLIISIVNLSLICWIAQQPRNSEGTYTVYEGSCSTTKWINSMGHLGINIASSILLMASNACMQCLSAPTRQVVSAEHNARRSVDIGVHSWRNLRLVPRGKLLLYALLAITSALLHVLYNSILFECFTTNQYMVTLVRPSFVEGDSWFIPPCAFAEDSLPDSLLYLQNHLGSFMKVSNTECLRGYSSDLVSQWGNVFLITDSAPGNSILNADSVGGLDNVFNKCHKGSWKPCDISYLLSHPDLEWRYNGCQENETTTEKMYVTFPVNHCLVQKVKEKCTVRMSLIILVVVLACNVVKFICMLAVLSFRNFDPLITIGDAIASFLNEEDLSTVRCGLLGPKELLAWKTGSLNGQGLQSRPEFRRRRWCEGVTRKRFVTSSFLLSVLTFGFLGLFIGLLAVLGRYGYHGYSFSALMSYGFGQFQGAQGIDLASEPLLTLSVAANSLQIGLSVAYLLYNDLLTRIMVTREWLSYSTHRKSLRVSTPVGTQRSTYFLQIPLRYGLTLLTVFAISHWILSQSFFVVLVKWMDYKNAPLIVDKGFWKVSLSWSPLAMMVMVIIGGILLIGFWAISWLKKYPHTGMPLVRSASVCISAACHVQAGDEHAATKRVQWGEVEGANTGGVRHATFSSKRVSPVVEGSTYV